MQRILLIAAVLVWLHNPAFSATPTTRPAAISPPVEKDGVSISVLKPEPNPADTQPRFIVRFTNTSNDYINLYDVEASWAWGIHFTNTDPCAIHPGPWRLRMDSIPHRYPIAHKQIKAGESLDVTVNLNDPPFTFCFVYEGAQDKPVAPVRRLSPGTYRMTIEITLQNPFGPGHHLWTGPLKTVPAEIHIRELTAAETAQPAAEQLAAYDKAIDQVIEKLQPNGFWMNGISPRIDLAKTAAPEDVIASAVNNASMESKAYRILRIRRVDHLPDNVSAALVRVGKQPKVVVYFPTGNSGWWTRFYDAELP